MEKISSVRTGLDNTRSYILGALFVAFISGTELISKVLSSRVSLFSKTTGLRLKFYSLGYRSYY